MESNVLMPIGFVLIVLGGFAYRTASWGFEAGMRFQGVDPERIDPAGRRSGIRRNELVGLVCALVGTIVLVWGVLA